MLSKLLLRVLRPLYNSLKYNLQMCMKENNDEVTTKTRILSLELLQVNYVDLSVFFGVYINWLIELTA